MTWNPLAWGYTLDQYFMRYTENELFQMKVVAWGVVMCVVAWWMPRDKRK